MIDDLELVALTRDLPAPGLRRGDVGTVVHRYRDGRAFEVEFVSGAGATLAVLTLEPPTSARWAATTSSTCETSSARPAERPAPLPAPSPPGLGLALDTDTPRRHAGSSGPSDLLTF